MQIDINLTKESLDKEIPHDDKRKKKDTSHVPVSFEFEAFFRKKLRGTVKALAILSPLLRMVPEVARCFELSRRSDKLVCMRRMATPFSSVEKSKPRWTDRIPVDISVLLADLKSIQGLGREAKLSPCTVLCLRDCDATDEGLDLLRAAKGLPVFA
jgi:hypothetical protein